ncbi:SymE family type I addiction module toxin [Caballeronia sp. LZ034LL]|uniref:SymE family type I addiction module toxin n=1 Tax=Caballeronia sp. LZ034LL TaxID=3038567 RepID=UPI0028603009|nr:SymE family type I addiction module toxin [Caballeronia sp. LZ034LL]MDR5835488.1 SymE family type I addiction module toxin [Caballeronia sp. LZ034LL]
MDRFVTVQQIQRNCCSRKSHWQREEPPIYPWLELAGRWIEQAGIRLGQRVKINVEHGRLVISAG